MAQHRSRSRPLPRRDVADVVARLDPLPRDAVALVYFEGHTPSEAARILEVEPIEVTSALAHAFRQVASWIADAPPPDASG